jgi:hypothetical protein
MKSLEGLMPAPMLIFQGSLILKPNQNIFLCLFIPLLHHAPLVTPLIFQLLTIVTNNRKFDKPKNPKDAANFAFVSSNHLSILPHK